jgi:putative spermidine/putrescine transport system ATP-binding protein
LKRRKSSEIRDRVRRALDQVSLQGYESRRTHELSGGQQQRVAIARALVNEPAALLLDEPLGALDLKLRSQMQLELKAIQRRLGTTFLYVTHDQAEAMTMSDRIAVMKDGRVAQIGSPVEIYRRPASAFVANFVGETNILTDARSGQIRTYSLRPEDVVIGSARADEPPGLAATATVESIAFLGSAVRYELRVSAEWLLIARTQLSGERMYAQGETVHVHWSTDRLVELDR